jgi:hypothetical protein
MWLVVCVCWFWSGLALGANGAQLQQKIQERRQALKRIQLELKDLKELREVVRPKMEKALLRLGALRRERFRLATEYKARQYIYSHRGVLGMVFALCSLLWLFLRYREGLVRGRLWQWLVPAVLGLTVFLYSLSVFAMASRWRSYRMLTKSRAQVELAKLNKARRSYYLRNWKPPASFVMPRPGRYGRVDTPQYHYAKAWYLAFLGRKTQALASLEKAWDEKQLVKPSYGYRKLLPGLLWGEVWRPKSRKLPLLVVAVLKHTKDDRVFLRLSRHLFRHKSKGFAKALLKGAVELRSGVSSRDIRSMLVAEDIAQEAGETTLANSLLLQLSKRELPASWMTTLLERAWKRKHRGVVTHLGPIALKKLGWRLKKRRSSINRLVQINQMPGSGNQVATATWLGELLYWAGALEQAVSCFQHPFRRVFAGKATASTFATKLRFANDAFVVYTALKKHRSNAAFATIESIWLSMALNALDRRLAAARLQLSRSEEATKRLFQRRFRNLPPWLPPELRLITPQNVRSRLTLSSTVALQMENINRGWKKKIERRVSLGALSSSMAKWMLLLYLLGLGLFAGHHPKISEVVVGGKGRVFLALYLETLGRHLCWTLFLLPVGLLCCLAAQGLWSVHEHRRFRAEQGGVN